MFEPQKLIAVGIAVVLLAPFGYAFWRIAVHQPRPEAEVRAAFLTTMREQQRLMGTPSSGGNFTASAGALRQVEAIALSESTASWLSFYPHRWAGILGLIGITFVMVSLLASLFVMGGVTVNASDLATLPTSEIL